MVSPQRLFPCSPPLWDENRTGGRAWVRVLGTGSGPGVLVEVEGASEALEGFLLGLQREKPAIAFIQSLKTTP